jgi:hypothetical protein
MDPATLQLGSGIYTVGEDVKAYIMKKLGELV